MSSALRIGQQLVELKETIVQHFSQSEWLSLGALTDHYELVDQHPRLLRSLSFGDPDYGGHVLSVLRKMVDDDSRNLATIMEYVQKKCPGVGESVSSHSSGGRRIVFSPAVFQLPSKGLDRRLVAVMMPFGRDLSEVYQAIQRAADDAELYSQRADDIWDDSTVIQDVFSLIFRSLIVVCDFSGRNPNVFYEAGIAHTLGKHVVPLTQSKDDIPFDLRHHRYLEYLNNSEGRETLRSDLARRLMTLASRQVPEAE